MLEEQKINFLHQKKQNCIFDLIYLDFTFKIWSD
jgi:hypothetical protein